MPSWSSAVPGAVVPEGAFGPAAARLMGWGSDWGSSQGIEGPSLQWLGYRKYAANPEIGAAYFVIPWRQLALEITVCDLKRA